MCTLNDNKVIYLSIYLSVALEFRIMQALVNIQKNELLSLRVLISCLGSCRGYKQSWASRAEPGEPMANCSPDGGRAWYHYEEDGFGKLKVPDSDSSISSTKRKKKRKKEIFDPPNNLNLNPLLLHGHDFSQLISTVGVARPGIILCSEDRLFYSLNDVWTPRTFLQ